MRLTNEQYRELREKFMQRWTVDSLEKMTLEEYNNIHNRDNFCYWIEHKTLELGSIKGLEGGGSFKFGIYEMKMIKDFKRDYLRHDGKYAWNNKYGNTPGTAFMRVRELVKETVITSQSGNFRAIDSIDLDKFFKWKIAYLYSNERLAPFFEWNLLNFAANYLGKNFEKGTPISEVQLYVMANKPKNKTIFEFSNLIWDIYNNKKTEGPNYYLVGSKWNQGKDDMFPEMLEKDIWCMGYPPNENLSSLFGKQSNYIDKELNIKLKNSRDKIPAKSALRHLLGLKPGDVLGIKDAGFPLRIRAYAMIVQRDDGIYSYDDRLGHCVNVQFLNTEAKREFSGQVYRRTIHRIEDKKLIKLFFRKYEDGNDERLRTEIIKGLRRRAGTKLKNWSPQWRSGSQGYIANQRHNEIQQRYYEQLVERFGEENVSMEKDFVDIELTLQEKIVLHEVKPYELAIDCIIASMGQLLKYLFYNENSLPKEVVIVGPNKATEIEEDFMKFVKGILNIDVNYRAFPI